jgi:tetratricopeptide (TPR) repeat protein
VRRRAGAKLAVVLFAAVLLAGCSHLVLLHDPLTASEHNDLGAAYESKGQLALASREYRAALRRNPHHRDARFNLGNIAAATGRWGAAEKCYRIALRDSATDADAMNNLAIALLRQGRKPAEARSLAERAVAMGGPRDSTYRATLAEVKAAGVSSGRPATREPSR